MFSGWVFFLGSLGLPHVLRAHMGVHRTCGGPNEIELAPIVVTLEGSRVVHGGDDELLVRRLEEDDKGCAGHVDKPVPCASMTRSSIE